MRLFLLVTSELELFFFRKGRHIIKDETVQNIQHDSTEYIT